ncbi:F-box only protein 36b isoform X2 [Xyrauchen texanus]|uniref:F-box only protein 36b isoform X2 n=1 Tax=Xyrauchen texanus TaxID=154827 RepID=UPI002241CD12|nr:F-box only protein 36b isoform X2 [Xyrauchen texanus]
MAEHRHAGGSQVIWRWWKISLRSECRNQKPGQLRESHEDYIEDQHLQSQVAMVFGLHILQYSKNLCQGHYDYIVRLPNSLLLKILAHLDLEDISGLSRTCCRFRELCKSEEFWEQTVRKNSETVTPTLEDLANEVGWRTIFFTNKLQLQMQISRRKQRENQPCEDTNEPRSF